MIARILFSVTLALTVIGQVLPATAQEAKRAFIDQGYAGSESCRQCHERFYQPWSTSRHGLAMQPYTPEFAKKNLSSTAKDIKIGKASYRTDVNAGLIIEKGPKGEKKYTIEHVLGGKNVYYVPGPVPERMPPDPSPCI